MSYTYSNDIKIWTGHRPLTQSCTRTSMNRHLKLSTKLLRPLETSLDMSKTESSAAHSWTSKRNLCRWYAVDNEFEFGGKSGGISCVSAVASLLRDEDEEEDWDLDITATSESLKTCDISEIYNLTISLAIVRHWLGLRLDPEILAFVCDKNFSAHVNDHNACLLVYLPVLPIYKIFWHSPEAGKRARYCFRNRFY